MSIYDSSNFICQVALSIIRNNKKHFFRFYLFPRNSLSIQSQNKVKRRCKTLHFQQYAIHPFLYPPKSNSQLRICLSVTD